ncbi:DEAD/DEAH box helicase [Candidatus Gracilibacteria bacterium CG17_big_fil_post_rev_8_21_14_2_50_48_13]|nr:MAG: DEAD/DEAH box helicase [Candidatus Gracilibacteria bacterium CG17_big_fil_post_rev_8_21_14_2_50_48_13]
MSHTFADLPLLPVLQKAISAEGYSIPTPIQLQAIPHILQRRDVLGIAQTGTGKTAAFALPILHLLQSARDPEKPITRRAIKVLICTPTRELALQIGESFATYGKFTDVRSTVIFGGVGQHAQVRALERGVDVLIATPGRLLDLLGQGYIRLQHLDTFVLDEADRMLDMGFIHDIKKVIKYLPAKRQSLFFSATLAPSIAQLAGTILHDPIKVEVTPVSSTSDIIRQAVYFVKKDKKPDLLRYVLEDRGIESALIFSRTKHGANRIAKMLNEAGVRAEAIHGNKSQNARQLALANFKAGKTRALVATDIAARGIDIDSLSHVINFDIPNEPETYVHRIGRTGRAGAKGIALSFCSEEECVFLRDIHKLISKVVPVHMDHPYHVEHPISAKPLPPARRGKPGRGGRPGKPGARRRR